MITVVGIDCATKASSTGLVLGRVAAKSGPVKILEARCASTKEPAADIIAGWIKGRERVLLALDSPLGWPAKLSPALMAHRAGAALLFPANRMFRRVTDDRVHERLGKRSLDVGADRIARTAHAANHLLQAVRELTMERIELAWKPNWPYRMAAIEVYPAATRKAYGVPGGPGSLEGLIHRFKLPDGKVPDSEHARDALVCVLAGADFLRGLAVAPAATERATAVQEGWIWVREAVGR